MKTKTNTKNLLASLEGSKWFYLSAIVFRVLLEKAYSDFVNPVFEYAGFILDLVADKYFESWIIYILLIVLFPKKLNRASDYLMAYLLFSFLAPLLVFYGLANANREHLFIVLLAVILILIFRIGDPIKLPLVRHGRIVAFWILAIGILFVTGWMTFSGGLKYFNLDFNRVYEFRNEAGDLINQGPMGYLNTWAAKVFGPTLLAISLWKKKYYLATAAFGLHILWFGISSHKAILFYPFLVTFLWAWFRSSKALALLPISMSIVVASALVYHITTEEILLGSMLVRRTFFVPSFLTFTYYDFFSHNSFVYWSDSITSSFISYPYSLNPAKLIGAHLGGESSDNNSFLSTGYMHAGIPGMIFYGVFVGLLFRLIDSLSSKGIPPWVAVATMIVPSQALLTSADLPTALLTHGLGIAVLLLLLLRTSNRTLSTDQFSDPRSNIESNSLLAGKVKIP